MILTSGTAQPADKLLCWKTGEGRTAPWEEFIMMSTASKTLWQFLHLGIYVS